MPHLMVDLLDAADCRRGIQLLRQIVGGSNPIGLGAVRNEAGKAVGKHAGVSKLPIRRKLERLMKRGVWPILAGIAALDESPRSLAEFDKELGLKANKMRSTKAIFAKLEKRFDIRFLVPAKEAGDDDTGNARYRMPPRVRNVIKRLKV